MTDCYTVEYHDKDWDEVVVLDRWFWQIVAVVSSDK
jgi:hypothetical protein